MAEAGMLARVVERGVRRSFRDHVIVVGCWLIDAVSKTVTFVISGAIVMIGGAALFVGEMIVKIMLGAVMLVITCWMLGAVFKICWMIWGPKIL